MPRWASGPVIGVGVGVVAVVCCAGPAIATLIAAISTGAVLGVGGAILAVAAVACVAAFRFGARRRRAVRQTPTPETST